MRMLHVKGWGWLEAADGKNLSQTRPAKSESEAYCKSGPARVLLHYLCVNVHASMHAYMHARMHAQYFLDKIRDTKVS